MKTWRKEASLLLVGLMMMSGLVAISAPVIADENVTIDTVTFTIDFNDANMWEDPAIVNDADQEIIINMLGAGTRPIYLGEYEQTIQFVVTASADPTHDVRFQLQGAGVVSASADSEMTVNAAAWTADLTQTIYLDIDTEATGEVERTYPLTVRVTRDPSGTPESGTIGVDVYVSSIFHDDTAMDDTHEFTMESGDYVKDDSGGDDAFRAGVDFAPAIVNFPNRAAFPIKDTQITLTEPTTTPAGQITLVHTTVAKYVGEIAAAGNEDLNWRVNVAQGTLPDVYEGTAAVEFIRDVNGVDVTIQETARPIDYTVGFNFEDTKANGGQLWGENQCYATGVTILNDTRQVDYVAPEPYAEIEQDTYTDRLITAEVTIVNNGNSDLYNVEFEIVPGLAATGWEYFRNPRLFVNSGGTVTPDTISDTVDLEIGETITLEIEMIVLREIPIGEHRLPIIYNGYYFDDGALGGSTGFMPTNGDADLQVIFSIFVVDDNPDFVVTDVDCDADDKGDITANEIIVSIENLEEYNFIHVMVMANFTGTPWYNPVIGMSGPEVWADEANEFNTLGTWAGGAEEDFTFAVDTDPSMVPDRYPFQLEITAVIEDNLEVVTVTLDYRHGAVVDFGGYGPRIQISAVAAEDIVPGQGFDMTLTIENVGDETLRDVWVWVDCDDTVEYDWDALYEDFFDYYDYSSMFENWGSETGAQFHWTESEFPEDIFYTVEKLDVDNMREIVEINLYTDGVYSTPGARISLIWINDLAPGAFFDVDYEMFADKDMVNGKPYMIEVGVGGIDSEGVDWSDDYTISVMSSLPGKSYNPVELNWFDAGLKALALFLFFIIVLAILLFVYNMFKGEPYDDDEDFDFEDDEPFEPIAEPIDESPEVMDTPEPESELVEP